MLPTQGGRGSIPAQGTETPPASQHGQSHEKEIVIRKRKGDGKKGKGGERQIGRGKEERI